MAPAKWDLRDKDGGDAIPIPIPPTVAAAAPPTVDGSPLKTEEMRAACDMRCIPRKSQSAAAPGDSEPKRTALSDMLGITQKIEPIAAAPKPATSGDALFSERDDNELLAAEEPGGFVNEFLQHQLRLSISGVPAAAAPKPIPPDDDGDVLFPCDEHGAVATVPQELAAAAKKLRRSKPEYLIRPVKVADVGRRHTGEESKHIYVEGMSSDASFPAKCTRDPFSHNVGDSVHISRGPAVGSAKIVLARGWIRRSHSRRMCPVYALGDRRSSIKANSRAFRGEWAEEPLLTKELSATIAVLRDAGEANWDICVVAMNGSPPYKVTKEGIDGAVTLERSEDMTTFGPLVGDDTIVSVSDSRWCSVVYRVGKDSTVSKLHIGPISPLATMGRVVDEKRENIFFGPRRSPEPSAAPKPVGAKALVEAALDGTLGAEMLLEASDSGALEFTRQGIDALRKEVAAKLKCRSAKGGPCAEPPPSVVERRTDAPQAADAQKTDRTLHVKWSRVGDGDDVQVLESGDDTVSVSMKRARPIAEERKEKSRKIGDSDCATSKDEEFLCKICFSSKLDTMCRPCKHLAMCEECSLTAFKYAESVRCPICRKPIESTEKVFIP
jgi:hypothetical protein